MTFLTPKQRLHTDEAALAQARATITDQVAHFLSIAYADYCTTLPGSDNPQTGWNANCKRQGALELMKRFLSLADASPKAESLDTGALLPDKEYNPMSFPPEK